MDLTDEITALMKQHKEYPLTLYREVRKFLHEVCSEGREFDVYGTRSSDGVNGYAFAAEMFFRNGHVAAADSLLIEAWQERENRQFRDGRWVYKAGISVKLADLYHRKGDSAASLRWALLTQADDILGKHKDRGGDGQWLLQTVLGVSENASTDLNDIADDSVREIESEHNDDWAHSRGFPEDVLLRFTLNPDHSSLFMRNSSVYEYPLSSAYLSALLKRIEVPHSQQKGKAWEDLASYLFLLIPAWIPQRNLMAEGKIFETDILIRNLNPAGNLTAELLGRHFLVECKNWKDAVGVPHVGYFLYRMRLTHAKFGVIFAPKGITGNETENARELIHRAFHEDGNVCVVIEKGDLATLTTGKTTFLSLLVEKMEQLRFGKPISS